MAYQNVPANIIEISEDVSWLADAGGKNITNIKKKLWKLIIKLFNENIRLFFQFFKVSNKWKNIH